MLCMDTREAFLETFTFLTCPTAEYIGFPLDVTSSRVTACSHAGRQAISCWGGGGWALSFICLFWLTLLNYNKIWYIYVYR